MRDCKVLIHVYDERRMLQKNFACAKSTLVSNMKYFEPYLTSESIINKEKIDISVNCDCFIFEWVMKYIQNTKKPPSFQNESVIHILIASEFLKIESLINLCITYISVNLKDVLSTRADLTSISNLAISKLAKTIQPEKLLGIHQLSNATQFISRIYKEKITSEFHSPSREKKDCEDYEKKLNSTSVECCKYCGKVLVNNERNKNYCHLSFQHQAVNYRGEFQSKNFCEPLQEWSLEKFVILLHRHKSMSYFEIYWHLWISLKNLCYDMDKESNEGIEHIFGCRFPHSDKFINADATQWGVFSCCGELELKFYPWKNKEWGCMRYTSYLDCVEKNSTAQWKYNTRNETNINILKTLKKTLALNYSPLYSGSINANKSSNIFDLNKRAEDKIDKQIIFDSIKGDKCSKEFICFKKSQLSDRNQNHDIFTSVPKVNCLIGCVNCTLISYTKGATSFLDLCSKLGMWIHKGKFTLTNSIGHYQLPSKPEPASCCYPPFNISTQYLDGFDRAKHSKQALSMHDKKRRQWFKDILNESETARTRDICLKLSAINDD